MQLERERSGAVVDWAWSAGSNAKKVYPAKQVQSTRVAAGATRTNSSTARRMADGDCYGTSHRCVHRMRASVCAMCSPVAAQAPWDELAARPWKSVRLPCERGIDGLNLHQVRPWCVK